MSFDHRLRVKNILLGVTATLDDGATAAQIIVLYSGGPENVKALFYVTDYDAVITIDRPRRVKSPDEKTRYDGDPLRYTAELEVHVMAVDKITVTATKLLNKIRASLQTTVIGAAWQAEFDIHLMRDSPNNQVIGGYDPLWCDDYVIRYRPLVST